MLIRSIFFVTNLMFLVLISSHALAAAPDDFYCQNGRLPPICQGKEYRCTNEIVRRPVRRRTGSRTCHWEERVRHGITRRVRVCGYRWTTVYENVNVRKCTGDPRCACR